MSAFLFKYTILRYLLPPDYKQELGRFAAYVRTHSAPEVYSPFGTHVRSDCPQTRHIAQKAGYHRHDDTLPLLVYRSE